MLLRTTISVLLSITFIIACAHCLYGEKPVKLYKEASTIALEQGSLDVRGVYYFENRSDFELDVAISYPIHISEVQPFPEKIKLFDPRDPVVFEKQERGIKWSQHFEPSGIETVLVSYFQILEQKRVSYILKRKVWGGKVDKISITIEAPISFQHISISIEPDSSKSDEHKQYFYITRRYFKAKQDLTITWE